MVAESHTVPDGEGLTPPPAPDEPSSPAPRADAVVGETMERARQPVYGQGIVVSLLAAAFLLILAIVAASQDESATGIPATETTGPLFWGIAALFTAIVAFGAQYSEVSASRAAVALGQATRPREWPTAWVVPTVGMLAAILLVATLHNTLMIILGPAIAFFSVGGSLLARDLLDDVTESTARVAAIVHTVVILVVAFLALSGVYINRMSLWVTVPLVAIFSGLLMLETLERGSAPMARRLGYAALGALAMAQISVVLDRWLTYGWTGGGVLLVCFYILAGVLLTRTQRGVVRSRDLAEFAIVGAIGMAILIWTR